MDVDYVRRAKRRLNRIDSDDFIDVQKTNIRVVELCDKAIYVNESNYEAFYIKGQALTNLEKYVEAIGEFVKALEIKEDYLDAWLGIANANRLNGDFDDSINVYDTISIDVSIRADEDKRNPQEIRLNMFTGAKFSDGDVFSYIYTRLDSGYQ